jgi:hypothetical protein
MRPCVDAMSLYMILCYSSFFTLLYSFFSPGAAAMKDNALC